MTLGRFELEKLEIREKELSSRNELIQLKVSQDREKRLYILEIENLKKTVDSLNSSLVSHSASSDQTVKTLMEEKAINGHLRMKLDETQAELKSMKVTEANLLSKIDCLNYDIDEMKRRYENELKTWRTEKLTQGQEQALLTSALNEANNSIHELRDIIKIQETNLIESPRSRQSRSPQRFFVTVEKSVDTSDLKSFFPQFDETPRTVSSFEEYVTLKRENRQLKIENASLIDQVSSTTKGSRLPPLVVDDSYHRHGVSQHSSRTPRAYSSAAATPSTASSTPSLRRHVF